MSSMIVVFHIVYMIVLVLWTLSVRPKREIIRQYKLNDYMSFLIWMSEKKNCLIKNEHLSVFDKYKYKSRSQISILLACLLIFSTYSLIVGSQVLNALSIIIEP